MDWIAPLSSMSAGYHHSGQRGLDFLLDGLHEEAAVRGEVCRPQLSGYSAFRAIGELPSARRRQLVFYLVEKIAAHERRRRRSGAGAGPWDLAAEKNFINELLLRQLLRCPLEFGATELDQLFDLYTDICHQFDQFSFLPASLLLWQLECSLTVLGAEAEMRPLLRRLRSPAFLDYSPLHEQEALQQRVQQLWEMTGAPEGGRGFTLEEDDAFGRRVNQDLKLRPPADRRRWRQLLQHAARARVSRPSLAYQRRADKLLGALAGESVAGVVLPWLALATEPELRLTQRNAAVVQGLIWMMAAAPPPEAVAWLERLARRCFGPDPLPGTLAEACFLVLAAAGDDGVRALVRLNGELPKTARPALDPWLWEAAAARGLNREGLLDRFLPDFGLTRAEKVEGFGRFRLVVRITSRGKVAMDWYTAEGLPLVVPPPDLEEDEYSIRRRLAAREEAGRIGPALEQQIRGLQKACDLWSEWSYPDFCDNYRDHGLRCWLTERLIWMLRQEGEWRPALWWEERWTDTSGRRLEEQPPITAVRLWRPEDADPREREQWRRRLGELGLEQPFPQVDR